MRDPPTPSPPPLARIPLEFLGPAGIALALATLAGLFALYLLQLAWLRAEVAAPKPSPAIGDGDGTGGTGLPSNASDPKQQYPASNQKAPSRLPDPQRTLAPRNRQKAN